MPTLKPAPTLRIVELSAVFGALELVDLPLFTGSAIRGALGAGLKSATCAGKVTRACTDACSWPHRCPYGVLMETPVPDHAPKRLKASKYAPHPILIASPLNGGLRYPGDKICLGVSLLGDAAHLIPSLVAGLARMAQLGVGKGRGQLALARVEDTCSGEPIWLQEHDDTLHLDKISPARLTLAPDPEDEDEEPTHALRVDLLTPLQLMVRGSLLRRLTFPELIYACADRFATLIACYSDTPEAHELISPVGWAERARESGVRVRRDATSHISVERYSARQERHHDLEGIVGFVEFEGELTEFLPLLRVAAKLQIGRKPSMGLGRFALTPLS